MKHPQKQKPRVDPKPANWDFEMDSDPDGGTLCGKLGRKHRMKRFGPMATQCIYQNCDGCC